MRRRGMAEAANASANASRKRRFATRSSQRVQPRRAGRVSWQARQSRVHNVRRVLQRGSALGLSRYIGSN